MTHELLGKTNDSAASDLGVRRPVPARRHPGRLAERAHQHRQPEGQGLCRRVPQKGQAMLDKALPLADKIYEEVLESL